MSSNRGRPSSEWTGSLDEKLGKKVVGHCQHPSTEHMLLQRCLAVFPEKCSSCEQYNLSWVTATVAVAHHFFVTLPRTSTNQRYHYFCICAHAKRLYESSLGGAVRGPL